MDAKKISFGFSKVAKKPNILPAKAPKEENKVELIKCLEGKEIKLVAEKQEIAPLIIQLATNQKTSTALASLMKRRAVLLGEDDADPEETTADPQSIAEVTGNNDSSNLEQRAARELLAAVQSNGNEAVEGDKLVLPALKADELPLDGAKESTIDDYDSIPIQQFGLAMLRGMGWKDPPPKKKGAPEDDAPFMRPKGMGLGADKALKSKALLVQPEKNEVLEIKKQAFVRILGGKQKDQYGQIEGFDDHAGRVIVKMAIGGAKEAFNEFLCQPVSRKEYAQYGKCINTAKYEEFKKHENEHGQIVIKREKSTERKDSVKTERKDRPREEERKTYRAKNEERSHRSRDEEHKSYRSRDEDRKPYKSEQCGIKTEDSRADSRGYRDERKTYKTEDRRVDNRAYKDERRQDERKAYKTEDRRRDDISSSSSRHRQESRSNSCTSKSSSRRRQQSTSDEADDTGESTESDSDSAYERKDKKKSKSKSKKKSKKSKSKSQRHRHSSDSQDESDGSTDERSRRKHKKKTKKSKHARSRTRSRSREGRGR
ncbi:hypothetical protein KR044_010454 [Drosophila immigrans]|nr:hypothetical protein KR044_010454 [Drosophila immigrans]